MKLPLLVFAILVVLSTAGCRQVGIGTARSIGVAAARGVSTARHYDRALWALQQNDNASLVRETREMRGTAGNREFLSLAEEMVRQGSALLQSQQRLPEARTQGEALLRGALQLSPDFPSEDPELINSLGYELADLGRNMEDWRMAEKLTRRSVTLYDQLIAHPGLLGVESLRILRALGPLDSLAWALHRQGRDQEAFKLQSEVMRTPGAASIPEVVQHMLEIERALGKHPHLRGSGNGRLVNRFDASLPVTHSLM